MKTQDFIYWLHGFSELTDNKLPDAEQWNIIKDHVELAWKEINKDMVSAKSNPESSEPRMMFC